MSFRLTGFALALALLLASLPPLATTATAQAPPPAELRVWQSIPHPERLFFSARTAGGSWADAGTVPLALDGVSRSGRYRYGDVRVTAPSASDGVEVRIWQRIGSPHSLYISARPLGGSWRTFGTRPLAATQVSQPGRYRYADQTLDLDRLALREAVGQMLMVGFRGATLDDEVLAMLRDVRPGGVVLFDYDVPSGGERARNVTSPAQLRALTAALQREAPIPLFIAIDAEGGFVNRLKTEYGFPLVVPSAQTLGGGATEATAAVAGALADELRAHGVNWNFAPVVDVNVDPDSPAIGRYERSFSADPSIVVAHASAFLEAHRQRGVITALKHFPGHGSAAGDTHVGVTDVTATFDMDRELAPYRALIGDGYHSPVMTAHIVNRTLDASARPATLSRAIMTELLRGQLGFGGVVVSDDMQMGAIVAQYGLAEAAVEAINAGVDIIMLANQQGASYDLADVFAVRDAILRAVDDGIIARSRIDDAAARIAALKRDYGIAR